MSYAIFYDWSEKYDGEDYQNLTADKMLEDDEYIVETEQFDYWYDDNKCEEDMEDFESEEEYKLSLVDDFRNSGAYDELRDTFVPMMSYVHILQNEPLDEAIELVEEYAGACVVIKIEELDCYGLALTGGGMDLSDYLELAYYILDGVSPIKSREVLSLRKEARELLEFCRNSKDGVCLYDIKKFLEEKKDGKLQD